MRRAHARKLHVIELRQKLVSIRRAIRARLIVLMNAILIANIFSTFTTSLEDWFALLVIVFTYMFGVCVCSH